MRNILRRRSMQGNVLRGVLAIGEVRHTDRGDLSLLSLEAYDDGFTLHWRITSTAPQPQDPSALRFRGMPPNLLGGHAEDDLGGEYEGFPGGGGGDGSHWSGEVRFAPAIADAATRLQLRLEEMDLASFMPGARSADGSDPWTFEISLAGMKAVPS